MDQYIKLWSVAVSVLVRSESRRFALCNIIVAALSGIDIYHFADEITLGDEKQINGVFPAWHLARTIVSDVNGRGHESAMTLARGNPQTPLSYYEIVEKFLMFCFSFHKLALDVHFHCK